MGGERPVVESRELDILEIEYRPAARKPRARLLDQILTRDEFLTLLRAGDAKDKTILALGIMGLRASEIAACRADWIDWGEGILTVPPAAAKKGHGRRIYLASSELIWNIVRAYFALEPEIGCTRSAVWQRVKKLARRAGLKKPLTVHGLRATGATWAAEKGLSAQALRELFGWSSLKTAEKYIAASGRTALKELQEKGGII